MPDFVPNRRFWLALFCTAVLSTGACGGGGTVYLGGSGGGATGTGDDNYGKTTGVVGAATVTTNSENYQMIITIGEPAPIGYLESESGVYEIQNTLVY